MAVQLYHVMRIWMSAQSETILANVADIRDLYQAQREPQLDAYF